MDAICLGDVMHLLKFNKMNPQAQSPRIQNGKYYMMVHKGTKRSLFLPETFPKFEKEQLCLHLPNQEEIGQLWMFMEVAPEKFPDLREIIHTASTLVLTLKNQEISLK